MSRSWLKYIESIKRLTNVFCDLHFCSCQIKSRPFQLIAIQPSNKSYEKLRLFSGYYYAHNNQIITTITTNNTTTTTTAATTTTTTTTSTTTITTTNNVMMRIYLKTFYVAFCAAFEKLFCHYSGKKKYNIISKL